MFRSMNDIYEFYMESTPEEWRPVIYGDIPQDKYVVSNRGHVLNTYRDVPVVPQVNNRGTVWVNLIGGRRYGLSLSKLVGETYLPSPSRSTYNSIMRKDGCPYNLSVDNLCWRPRWYTNKYGQWVHSLSYEPRVQSPVVELGCDEIYADPTLAALRHGVLYEDVLRSIRTGKPTRITNHRFRLL